MIKIDIKKLNQILMDKEDFKKNIFGFFTWKICKNMIFICENSPQHNTYTHERDKKKNLLIQTENKKNNGENS